MQLNIHLTAVFEKAEEGGYIAYIEEIPGANTQGESLEEARLNLEEALQMVLEANKALSVSLGNPESSIRETLLLAS
jgi:predicted RNase H-like HicB family nuclease